jgi:CubicO group peptidase (beta-lactamase class C family)
MFISTVLLLFACQTNTIINVTKSDNLDKIIESEFKRLQMPGLAYVAVKEDSIVYVGAKGYMDKKDKKLFTPQTRMLIASISKTIAVTAIMQLYEGSLVSLDEDINNYLPFNVRNPEFPEDKITVKMLLTHTSSISDDGYLWTVFYFNGYVDYPESMVSFEENYLTKGGKYYSDKSFSKNKPGSNRSYSNIGATLLACIVEHVSGTDYNTYCKNNIFKPLGMRRTTWFFSETPQEEVAIPYADNSITNPANPFFTYPDYADGHLITTIDDLSIFLRAYIMSGNFNNYQLLKPETITLILHTYVPYNSGEEQGLIFYNKQIGNNNVWGHDGDDPGVSTDMFFDTTNKTGYIMFNNRWYGHSETIGNALLLYANNNQ